MLSQPIPGIALRRPVLDRRAGGAPGARREVRVMATTSGVSSASPHDARGRLERSFIEAYLRERGHTWQSAAALPPAAAQALLAAAAADATLRLTEIESRAHYVGAIQGNEP